MKGLFSRPFKEETSENFGKAPAIAASDYTANLLFWKWRRITKSGRGLNPWKKAI